MSLVWINGRLVDKAEARVSPFDHGFLYGDGVWEPLRVFGGRLFRLEDHLVQLQAGARVLGIDAATIYRKRKRWAAETSTIPSA